MRLMYRLSRKGCEEQFVATGDGSKERAITVCVTDLTPEQRRMLLDAGVRPDVPPDADIYFQSTPTGVTEWPDEYGKACLTQRETLIDRVLAGPDEWFGELGKIVALRASFADALAERQAEFDREKARRAEEKRQEGIRCFRNAIEQRIPGISTYGYDPDDLDGLVGQYRSLEPQFIAERENEK